MLVPLLATAAAVLPFGETPAVDGATTFYASFDDERQPAFGLVIGEPIGDAEPIADGLAGGAWRLREGSTARFQLADEAWNREEGTLEFWLRPEWEEATGESNVIVSMQTSGSDRLYVNRLANGRFGAAILGGSAEEPRWVRTDVPDGSIRRGEWHHVAVGWGNGTLELRVDGVLLASPVRAEPMAHAPIRLELGAGDFSIDDLRISDIARYPGPVVDARRPVGVNRAIRRYPLVEQPESYAFDRPPELTEERFRVASVHPSTEPSRDLPPDSTPTLTIHAARGRLEPAKLVVYALADLGALRVRMKEAPVAGLGLETRRVVRSPTRRFYRGPPEDREVVPRFLVAADGISVPAGELRELWLTFAVPEDAPAGVHAGALELSVAGSPPTTIPLSLEVFPFALREPSAKRMGMYYLASRRMIEPTRLRTELDDLRAHGVTDLVLDFRLRWRRTPDGVQVSCPGLERFVEAATAAGFRHTLVIDTGFTQLEGLFPRTQFRKMVAAARQGAALIAELDRRFPGEIAVTHLDEVFNDDRLDHYIRLSRLARAAGYPRLYVTFHTRDARAESKRRRLAPFVDIRGHHGFTFEWWLAQGHSIAQYEKELREAGSEAWMYHNVRGSYFPPIWARLINGVYLRASPFVLNAPWVYQDYQRNPYDDADSKRTDFGMAFPEPDGRPGLAPTLIWEEMREGLDDLLTLGLLESLAREDPDLYAGDLAWLRDLDGLTRKGVGVPRPLPAPSESTSAISEDGAIDLDTGLRFGVGGIGTRQEAPLIDALSRRLDGPSLDAIRLEASRRIARILRSKPASPAEQPASPAK